MKIGDFHIHHIVENRFKGDGGAMYGIVPKKVWSRFHDVDENNMVHLHTNVYLIQGNGRLILIDSGFGEILTPKARRIYCLENPGNLLSGLKNLGFDKKDITDIVLTHLHIDHASGILNEVGSKRKIGFENAKVWVQAREIEAARNLNERTKNAYISLDRLLDFKGLRIVDKDRLEIEEGVFLTHTGGHCEGHQMIEVATNDSIIVFPGDIIPNKHFYPIPYISSTDLFPLESMNVKRRLYNKLESFENAFLAFTHETMRFIVPYKELKSGIR